MLLGLMLRPKTGFVRASFLFLLILALLGCDKQEHYLQLSGQTMGTVWHVTLAAPASQEAHLQEGIEGALQAINHSMSTYLQDSEIQQLNRHPVGQWLAVSEDFFRCLELSAEVSRQTDGALDITIAPLVNLWGFGPDYRPIAVPQAEAIAAARQRVDYRAVDLQSQEGIYQARRLSNVVLDLSAVAKGYGVDKVASYLSQQGIDNYMVEVGGELRVAGLSPRGGPWRIGIESPLSGILPGQTQKAMAISDTAIATSGDYRNYFEEEGVRYSHTIDPRSGKPVSHQLASVTVVAETAARADALATAFTVLGPEQAYRKAVELNIAAFFIIKDGESFIERYTPSFETFLN